MDRPAAALAMKVHPRFWHLKLYPPIMWTFDVKVTASACFRTAPISKTNGKLREDIIFRYGNYGGHI